MFRWLAVFILFALGPRAWAEVPGPPLPAKYRAVVRYRIVAPRDIHVAHYDAMIEHFQGLGFVFDPPLEKHAKTDREDPFKNEIAGLVPGKNAIKLLHNRSVVSLLLIPEDFKLPQQPDQQVHVRLELSSGIPPERQRALGEQVRLLLGLLGFRESFGYDNHGYGNRPFTRLAGTIPAGHLDLLLRDLRTQPTNWFAPVIPTDDLPSPLRQVNPILVTEVLPDPEPAKDVDVPARASLHLEKLSPELWALTQQKEQESRSVRLQVMLIGKPSPGDKELRFNLREAAPSLLIDTWLGQIFTGSAEVRHVAALAALPEVSAVRLTRTSRIDVDPKAKVATDNARALEASGLSELHRRGFRGKKVRLAILDSDFRGWEKMVADGKLPTGTSYVDLTASSDLDLLPAPLPGNGEGIGHGTQCALAAALAAPEADLTLLRLEGTAPSQIAEVVRFFAGDPVSEAMQRRRDDLLADRMALRNRREELLLERKRVLEDFSEDSEIERSFGFLGPVMGWIFSERHVHYQRMRHQEKREKELADRYERFTRLAEQIEALKGIELAANVFDWRDGYPLGGASALSRDFHQRSRGKLLWFQAAGNTRGQAWTGLFRDVDGNGILQFAQTPPKPGRWTNGINFLGWEQWAGEHAAELPAQARVRVTVQWREPHDPDYYTRPGEDPYLEPLANLHVQVLRQRDGELKTLPADAFDVVARSSRLPARLEHMPGYSIYEHSTEFTVDQPSRHALRIERQLSTRWLLQEDPVSGRIGFALLEQLVPTGLRPRGVATLTALEKNWELRLRVFVDVLDDANRVLGRVVLGDHATNEGSLGVPADARGVITIGAVDPDGKPLPSSAGGPPAFQELAGKPDAYTFAGLQVVPEGSATAYGTSLANAFAGGWAASLRSSGLSSEEIRQVLQRQRGKVLRVPPAKEVRQ